MIASLLLLILGTVSATYQPGTPGGKWSDEQAEIIRDKLHYLWQDSNPNKFVRKFVNKNSIDNKNGDIVENNHWVYDPYRRLETVDCAYYGLCQSYWSGKRWGNMAFTPPKALRRVLTSKTEKTNLLKTLRLNSQAGISRLYAIQRRPERWRC